MVVSIGYLAFAMNVAGNLLLAHKNIAGWIVRIATNVVWVIYAVQINDGAPVVLNHVAFMAINLYGLNKWWSRDTTHPV